MSSTLTTIPTPKMMKAVVWEGHPYHMSVKQVPRPTLQSMTDVIVRVTSSAICGSDIHTYHGLLGGDKVPYNMGHEAVGIVVEAGSEIETLKVGSRVVVPAFCEEYFRAQTGLGTYGFGDLLPGVANLGGCQAEYTRIPDADENATQLPDGYDNEYDYLMLSDIWPTAWGAVSTSGFQAGDSVAVFGCGPVGLLAAYSALLRGASKVYSIDHVDSRLAKADSIGAVPIDLKKGDPADQILKLEPDGVRRVCDLVGFECVNSDLKPQENYVIQQAVKVAGVSAGIALTGVYNGGKPTPGEQLLTTKLENIDFPIAQFWVKGISVASGIAYQILDPKPLKDLIVAGKGRPSFIVDREISIDEVPQAYQDFSNHKYGKTVIRFWP